MGILGILGAVIMFVGYIWLIVVAFKTSGALWGIINIFFQPITGLIFCIVKKTGWMQFGIMILGLVIFMIGGGMAAMSAMDGAGGLPVR
jgi:hypothetical protein